MKSRQSDVNNIPEDIFSLRAFLEIDFADNSCYFMCQFRCFFRSFMRIKYIRNIF